MFLPSAQLRFAKVECEALDIQFQKQEVVKMALAMPKSYVTKTDISLRMAFMAYPYCGAAVQPAESLCIGPNICYRPASLGQRHTPRLVDNPG